MTCLSSARLAYFSNRPLGMLVPQIDASQWAKTFIERTLQEKKYLEMDKER